MNQVQLLWNIDPLPQYSEPLPMVFQTPTYDISNTLPIEYQTPFCLKLWVKCNWYGILTPSHGILNPFCLLIRNEGVQNTMGLNLPYGGSHFSIRVFNIPWMKIGPGVNIPWGSKYHMTPALYTLNYPHTIRVYRISICKLLLQ